MRDTLAHRVIRAYTLAMLWITETWTRTITALAVFALVILLITTLT